MATLDPTPDLPASKSDGGTLSANDVNLSTTAIAAIAAALGEIDDGSVETVADFPGQAETYTDDAVSTHNTAGATAHTDKPVMYWATADGVFEATGEINVYGVPYADWALPSLTGLADGTLIFRGDENEPA